MDKEASEEDVGKTSNIQNNLEEIIFVIVFGSIVIMVGGSILNFGRGSKIELVSIFINGSLTFLLIIIYSDIAKREEIQSIGAKRSADSQEMQTKVQKKQTELQKELKDIQEEQHRIMEANHQPILQINDWEPIYTSNGKDHIRLKIENKGNGLAKGIKLEPNIGIFVEMGSREIVRDATNAVGPTGTPEGIHSSECPVVPESSNVSGESGAVLQPGEKGVFRSNIRFKEDKFDEEKLDMVTMRHIPFSYILNEVNSADSLLVSIDIHYEDVLGESETDSLYSERVNPNGAESLEEIIQ